MDSQTTLTGSEPQRYQHQEQERGRQCSRVWRTRHGLVLTPAFRVRDAVPAPGAALSSLLAQRFCDRGSSNAASRPSSRVAPTLSHQGPGRRPPTPKRSDAPQRRFYSRQRAAGVEMSEVRCPGDRVQEGALPEPAHLRAAAQFS